MKPYTPLVTTTDPAYAAYVAVWQARQAAQRAAREQEWQAYVAAWRTAQARKGAHV